LRYLSELPDMLKNAFEKYQEQEEARKNLVFQDVGADLETIFRGPLQLYSDYSEILVAYSKTKFMQDLYRDIKTQVQKIKVGLSSELENLKGADEK